MRGARIVYSPMHRLACLIVLCYVSMASRAQTPLEEPRTTAPLALDDPKLAEPRKSMQEMVEKGADGPTLLAADSLLPMREVTEFRRLVRERAPQGEATMAPKGEAGTPLVVRGKVVDGEGKPVAEALVYAYQTNQKGWYSDRAPHFAGDGGDFAHARLFAYVRTNAKGEFVLRTIRPGGYPRSTLPEHIHWQVFVGDVSVGIGEVMFDDDKRLTKEARDHAGRGVVIEKPEKDGAGIVVKPTVLVDIPKVTPKK